jgi:hypothetical protein
MILKYFLKLSAWKAEKETGCGWTWHRIVSTGKFQYWQLLGFYSGAVEVSILLCHCMICARCLGTVVPSAVVKRQNVQWTLTVGKLEQMCCLRTLGTIHSVTQCNVREKQRP